MKVRKLAARVFLAGCLAAAAARAQNADSAPLVLSVELGGTKLDADAVRKAVELELGRPVTLGPEPDGPALLVAAHANHTVTVSYRAANGLKRSRTIGIPQDNARSAEVIALLSGNLSRDEAAELLAGLAAKEAPAATSAAETPPAEPAKPEPPAAPEPEPVKALPSPAAKPAPQLELKHTPVNASLLAPLTLFPHTARRSLNAELGLFYSHVGELRGAGVNAIALNTVGDVHGAGIASLYARSGGTLHGFGASGVVLQSGGLEGLQVAGVLNLSAGSARGASIAGAVNLARQIEGLQAAGAVNLAERISGLQLGIVNIAREVNGVQIGVVNVAKHVKGTSIGLVSVADNGRVQPVLYIGTQTELNAGVKFTIGPFYTQTAFGSAPGKHLWQYELGVGAHLPLGRWFVEPGVHYSEARDTRDFFGSQVIEYAHYRVAAGIDLGRVSPFVGGGILQRFAHSASAPNSVPVTAEGFAGVAFF